MKWSPLELLKSEITEAPEYLLSKSKYHSFRTINLKYLLFLTPKLFNVDYL